MNKGVLIPVIASIILLGTISSGIILDDAEAKKEKVTICHKPGTPAEKTMQVPPQAVPGHLGHGDTLGECGAEPPDDEPPIITANTSPAPNANGWNNTDVVVSFGCVDNEGGSGVASVTGSILVSTEGAAQGVIGTCTDVAGNSATVTVFVSIDKTIPTGTVLINNGDATTNSLTVTLTITCLDFLSGCISMQVAVDGTVDTEPVQGFASPIEVTLPAGDGTKTVAVIVIDIAGNPSAQVTDSIVVEPSIEPTSGGEGVRVTVNDPQGRIMGLDIIVFIDQADQETLANVINPEDPNNISGNVPQVNPGPYTVEVRSCLACPPIFPDTLNFEVT